ncbi:TPA: ribokinase [Staphylococcus aureus]|uniref:ribokinase n=1 Tax=Staphylococcus aureus TaxID=1280 RepID=UPI000ACA2706|nr:ribokinase [Staphylococcus aureus]GBS79868.1 putative ribokinase [Staphylococcus aureus]GBS82469.1 putative ribokinase [Staphylococcus aureus]GBS84985.1 putative ribokinase [Staphylococcus aureus]GBT27961.1 putative ribokinase [Staphylococcus aureus]GBT79254.1 putative ribokinase [Staphylococcus aureus]
MTNKVVILGSTNVDQFLTVERYAQPGETLHVEEAQKAFGGGKGANQAIATARMQADTTFITKIGTDGVADLILEDFKAAHIDTSFIIKTTEAKTGQAFITVNAEGQNTIYVYGGANMTMTPEDVINAKDAIINADFVVAQLEVPIPAIISTFEIAKAHGVTTVLNPAPAKALPNELLSLIDIIVPNETEAELLSGIKVTNEQSMKDNANYFLSLGIKTVLITLGKQGTYFATKNQSQHIEAYKVNAIDTTAAGDTFIGAFVSHLNKSQDNLADAIDFGNKASSLTVQKHGAQASIPLLEEVNQV